MDDRSRHRSNPSRPAWLRVDRFPFTSRLIDAGGTTVHYIDEGAGPALVMVSAGFWSFMFRDLVLRLRDRFRCIVLDFPGCGLSPAGDEPGDQNIPASAHLLEQFAASLDLQDVTLLLHDVGGPIGFLFAARHPDCCRALVVANTFAWPLGEYRYVRSVLRLIGTPVFGAVNSNFNLLATVTASRFGAGRHFDSVDRAIFMRPWRARSARRMLQAFLAGAGRAEAVMERLERTLPEIIGAKPVLTLFGRRNDPWGWQDRFGRMFVNVTARGIEDGHHFPFCDDPDRFGAEVVSWWERVVAPVPLQPRR